MLIKGVEQAAAQRQRRGLQVAGVGAEAGERQEGDLQILLTAAEARAVRARDREDDQGPVRHISSHRPVEGGARQLCCLGVKVGYALGLRGVCGGR